MRIMMLSYYFPPEVCSGPHLPYELGESLVRLGHDVTVVTSFPRYHVPVMPLQYRRKFFYKEEMGGMTVLRINAPNAYAKTSVVRGIVQQFAPWALAFRALFAKRPDIIFTQTPPLLMGFAARLVACWFRIPCVVNVQDLFPQCAVDLGLLRNRAVIRVFEAMERRMYRSATAITVMSEGNRDFVIGKGATAEKVFTVPNWVDTEMICPRERMNDFRAAHSLGNQFVVLFAGTMGWSQGLDTVVEAARHLAAEPDLLFLLVGDGVELEGLKKRAAGLPNVRFLPMQPREVYPQVLSACDTALVTLRPEVVTPTVPSKICTIMAAARPVLASLPLCGDAPRLITEAGCGVVVPAGDARALAAAVLALKQDQAAARRMGGQGRCYAEKHLSRTVCVRENEELFRSIVCPGSFADSSWAISSVNIHPAERADLDEIVRVHLAAFPADSTLSSLGSRFLRKYYDLILRFDQGILLLAQSDDQVVGFVAGFVTPKRFYQRMKAERWRFALPVLTGVTTHPRLLLRVLPLVRRVMRPGERPYAVGEIACELSSIAVDPAVFRKGVGRALVSAFTQGARAKNAHEVYLTTDALNNAGANLFYRELSFHFTRCYSPPGHRLMNEYVLALSAESPPAAVTGADGPHAAPGEIPAAQTATGIPSAPAAPPWLSFGAEQSRMRTSYSQRPVVATRSSWFNPGHLYVEHDFERRYLDLLKKTAVAEVLGTKTVLEVGCGIGRRLRQLIKWGAQPENLVGMDLLPEAVAEARRLCPAAVRLLCGDPVTLDFPDASFDLVLQSTVLTSILDTRMRHRTAREILRVLKPDGLIIWHDFFVDNPQNPHVRAITSEEIEELFPGCRIELRRITLAPAISQKLAPYCWTLCYLLERIPWLRTHYLGVIRKG